MDRCQASHVARHRRAGPTGARAFEAVRSVASVEGGPSSCDVVVLGRDGRIFVSSDPLRFPVGSLSTLLTVPLQNALRLTAVPGAVALGEVTTAENSFSTVNVPLLSDDRELVGTLLMSSISTRRAAVPRGNRGRQRQLPLALSPARALRFRSPAHRCGMVYRYAASAYFQVTANLCSGAAAVDRHHDGAGLITQPPPWK
jgi:hypothetical protein